MQYLRSGMEVEDATARLRESLMPDAGRGRESGEAGGAGEGRTDLDATALVYCRTTVCDAQSSHSYDARMGTRSCAMPLMRSRMLHLGGEQPQQS